MLGRFTRSPTLALVLALAWTPTYAGEAVEEVIVTGSYIGGAPEDAAFPVQILDRDDIIASGVSDPGELIRNLEINSGSDSAPAIFGNGSSNGVANVNLRGLGRTSTLVLLDGKRMTESGDKAPNGDRFVDINTIPITMIERVEVLKDGGSAIYGTDAVAGVTNFITRKSFEGIELRGNLQRTTDGNSQDRTMGAIWGWADQDRRTHLVIAADWFDRTDMDSTERPKIRQAFPKQAASLVNRTSVTNIFPIATPPFFATDIPDPQCEGIDGGFFPSNAVDTDPLACNRDGALKSTLIPEQSRYGAMLSFDHEFNENVQVYTEFLYSKKESGGNNEQYVGPIEPKFWLMGLNLDPATFFTTVPANHPGTNSLPSGLPGNGGPIPDAPFFGLGFPGIGVSLIDFQTRVPGFGTQRSSGSGNNSITRRYQLGAKGSLFGFEEWSYDASVTYNTNDFDTHGIEIHKDRLELATYGFGGPDCVPDMALAQPGAVPGWPGGWLGAPSILPPFGILAGLYNALEFNTTGIPGFPFINLDNMDTAALSTNDGQGECQFFNPHLTRFTNPNLANSNELLEWLEEPIEGLQKTDADLFVADLVFSGDLFELPAGPLQAAFGAQYRIESRQTNIDPIFTGSVNSHGQLAGAASVRGLSENREFDEDRNIWAVFGELKIPITETLEAQLAARYADYGSSLGNTVNPKFALRWQPVDQFMMRGSVSTSFKAPSLAQVNEGTGFSIKAAQDALVQITDPVNGGNCVRTGRCAVPQANDPTLEPTLFVNEGLPSPSLDPEEAVSVNAGFQYTVLDGAFQDLSIGVDYWRFWFDDKILELPFQQVLADELELFLDACQPLPNGACDPANGDFVIINLSDPDFGVACDPTDPQFDPDVPGTGETCQVNPAAYSLGADVLRRRNDKTASLQIIRGAAINTGEIDTDGIDVAVSWPVQTDNLGTFVFSNNFTWIHQWEASNFPEGTPDFDGAGQTNRDPNRSVARSMPDKKGTFTINWLRDRHSITTSLRYILNYEDDAPVTFRLEKSMDSYYALDFRYNYRMPIGDSELTMSFGVIDAFNSDVNNTFDSNGFDSTVVDPRQRRIYGGVTYSM